MRRYITYSIQLISKNGYKHTTVPIMHNKYIHLHIMIDANIITYLCACPKITDKMTDIFSVIDGKRVFDEYFTRYVIEFGSADIINMVQNTNICINARGGSLFMLMFDKTNDRIECEALIRMKPKYFRNISVHYRLSLWVFELLFRYSCCNIIDIYWSQSQEVMDYLHGIGTIIQYNIESLPNYLIYKNENAIEWLAIRDIYPTGRHIVLYKSISAYAPVIQKYLLKCLNLRIDMKFDVCNIKCYKKYGSNAIAEMLPYLKPDSDNITLFMYLLRENGDNDILLEQLYNIKPWEVDAAYLLSGRDMRTETTNNIYRTVITALVYMSTLTDQQMPPVELVQKLIDKITYDIICIYLELMKNFVESNFDFITNIYKCKYIIEKYCPHLKAIV